jgi:hypothetical protein
LFIIKSENINCNLIEKLSLSELKSDESSNKLSELLEEKSEQRFFILRYLNVNLF